MLFGDKGYLTNYFGFFLTFMLLYFMLLKSKSGYAKDPEERRAEERELKAIPYLAIGALVVALALPWLIGLVGNPEKVSYDRSNRRISMFALPQLWLPLRWERRRIYDGHDALDVQQRWF